MDTILVYEAVLAVIAEWPDPSLPVFINIEYHVVRKAILLRKVFHAITIIPYKTAVSAEPKKTCPVFCYMENVRCTKELVCIMLLNILCT